MKEHDSRNDQKQPITKAEAETSSRHYASFLLRLWLTTSNTSSEDSDAVTTQLPIDMGAIKGEQAEENNIVLQVQHLQTGVVWRISSLAELNHLLMLAVKDEDVVEIKQSIASEE